MINLKRAALEDVDKILEVEKSVVGTKIYSGLTSRDDAIKEMAHDFYYLIEKDDRVVGNTSYEMKGAEHAYISGLTIAKEFQGQGIARQAMQILLEKLKDIKLIDLVTHPENEKAIKLYESLGFEKAGEPIPNYFNDGEPRIRMVLEK